MPGSSDFPGVDTDIVMKSLGKNKEGNYHQKVVINI